MKANIFVDFSFALKSTENNFFLPFSPSDYGHKNK